VTQEVESDFAGVLLKIALPEGEAPVGETIAWIGEAGEEITAPVPVAAPAAAVAAPPSSPAPATQLPAETSSSNGGRVKASPLARRLARERGVDLSSLRGTGPDGRIVAEDVERGAATAPAAAPASVPAPVVFGEVETVPLTNVRKTIARRLTAAWQAPVFQLTVSADMTRTNELVAKARALDPDVRVTVTDVLAKVCAAALKRHRDVNVAYHEDSLLRYPTANIGIAVAAPQGLVVPVISSVELRSLSDVARARGEVVERARSNKLIAGDLDGGTFTISNLGMFGIEQFVAVLNPPQAAILAVGSTEDRPVVVDGELVVRPMMTMTLTVDHRAVDGAEGADFLRTVKQLVEEPALAL
jgi:pyruvate dehydrogenase E2 component (dihydrolipoamide acetyltransferase)